MVHTKSVSSHLKDVSLQDVVTQFHRLLPVEFSILSGEHEGQESMAAPADTHRDIYIFTYIHFEFPQHLPTSDS